MKNAEVLLVQPPYLRIVGSHNDRVPLELCYLARYLKSAGINAAIFNADWTGANVYIKWKQLFANFHYLEDAVNGASPLFDETIERILSFNPRVVVLAAGDQLTPWVDLGNPYVAAILSEKLRKLGVRTVGVGPFYTRHPEKFSAQFDALLLGVASPSIVEIVTQTSNGLYRGVGMDINSIPLVDVYPSTERDDVVMTAIGCVQSCTFCLARDDAYVPIPSHVLIADIQSRRSKTIDFGDAILPLNLRRLAQLVEPLSKLGKVYSCEVNSRSVSERSLSLLKAIGVRSVKIGMESGDNSVLASMKKGQTVDSLRRAVGLIKSAGIRVTAYVLLGGPHENTESVDATYKLCREIEADDYVVNVWSFHDLHERDFRYDSHFSQTLVKAWGLEDTIGKFFDLQAPIKEGLGRLF